MLSEDRQLRNAPRLKAMRCLTADSRWMGVIGQPGKGCLRTNSQRVLKDSKSKGVGEKRPRVHSVNDDRNCCLCAMAYSRIES